jgi:CheY-like chemotaxis protein
MPNQRNLRVLVVEDNQEFARALALSLRADGHEVAMASDGSTALASAGNVPPDVVLLDISLPGMDGFAVANGIRERSASKRPFLVALTGRNDAQALQSSHQAGIDLHLVKPVDPTTLQGLLVRLQAFLEGVEGIPEEGTAAPVASAGS